MSTYKLKSHIFEDGSFLLLKDHLSAVGKVIRMKIEAIALDFSIPKKVIEDIGFIIGVSHDFAKATNYFQVDRLEKGKKHPKTNHSQLSSLVTYCLVKEYASTQKREIEEDVWCLLLPLVAFLIVLKHHSTIEGLSSAIALMNESDYIWEDQVSHLDPEIFEYQFEWNGLKVDFARVKSSLQDIPTLLEYILLHKLELDRRLLCREIAVESSLLLLFFLSCLLEADRSLLILGETEYFTSRVSLSHSSLEEFRKNEFGDTPGTSIDAMRRALHNELVTAIRKTNLDERVYSINLPTGTGKTLNAMATALQLKEMLKKKTNTSYKIIYCLPFMSIIDQTDAVFSKVFREEISLAGNKALLSHHSLSDPYYRSGEDALALEKGKFLINTWQSELVLTTFDQFLYSFFHPFRSHILKFNNLFNSIIILDEVQSIPYKLWLLINKVFQVFVKVAKSYVILMSATQPLIFEKETEIKDLVGNHADYFKQMDRFDLHVYRKEIEFEEFKQIVLDYARAHPTQDIMIVLNTINSSLELYEFLSDNLPIRREDLYYLSSNIIPHDRLERIKKVKMLTNRQDKNNNSGLLVVATQVIEAGVDIDLDVVIRDIGPLDSINQVCGRCNRNFRKKRGLVEIYTIKSPRGRLFASYVYDSILLDITRSIYKKDTIPETELLGLSESFYQEIKSRTVDVLSKQLLEKFQHFELAKLDFKKHFRTQSPQKTVFVPLDETGNQILQKVKEIQAEKSWKERQQMWNEIKQDFQKYSLQLTISDGQVNRLGKKVYLSELSEPLISDQVFVLDCKYYDEQIGLNLKNYRQDLVL